MAVAVAADGDLNCRFGTAGHADRSHVAGWMRTNVTDSIDHLGSQQRRWQPRIHRGGHAVLADHQTVNRRTQGVLQHLDRLDVVDAQHLPFGAAGRRADRGGRRDVSIVGNLIHRN
jgi:hypothetical protein